MANDINYKELYSALIDKTGFDISSDALVLNDRRKVPTPVEAINCLLGGGIPFGTVAHSYGKPASGKSTVFYQTMGKFQQMYPDGVSVIIDTESSSDGSRLRYFGIDTDRVLRLPATSIESGFIALLKMLENKAKNKKLANIPVFAIWDTISKGLATDSSSQSRMNAQDRARIIKNYMSPTMAMLERQEFILCLLNQVVVRMDSYGHAHEESGGGVALKHDTHFSMHITRGKEDWDGAFMIRCNSSISIDKSKISPELSNIPLIMDVTRGGMVDELRSFVDYMYNIGYVIHIDHTSKYNMNGFSEFKDHPLYSVISDFNKDYKNYDSLIEIISDNQVLLDTMRFFLMYKLSNLYGLQAHVIKPYMEQVYNSIISMLPAGHPAIITDKSESADDNEDSNTSSTDTNSKGSESEEDN